MPKSDQRPSPHTILHSRLRKARSRSLRRRGVVAALLFVAALVASGLVAAGVSSEIGESISGSPATLLQSFKRIIGGNESLPILEEPPVEKTQQPLPSPQVVKVQGDASLEKWIRSLEGVGEGTQEDPWIVDGRTMGQIPRSIMLKDTEAHLVIRNLALEGDGQGVALGLHQVTNVTLKRIEFTGFSQGLSLENAFRIRVLSSHFAQNSVAVHAQGVEDVTISDSVFQHNGHALRVQGEGTPGGKASRGIEIARSLIEREDSTRPFRLGSGLVLHGQDHLVKKNTFIGHDTAAVRDHSQGSHIIDNEFRGGSVHAVLLDGSRDAVVEGNRFMGYQEDTAIMDHRSRGTLIRANHVENSPGGAVGAVHDRGLQVVENNFFGDGRSVLLWSVQEATVRGNFMGPSELGVRVTDSVDVQIHENHVADANDTALRVLDSWRVQVENNTVTGDTRTAFQFMGGSRLDVDNNQVVGAGTAFSLSGVDQVRIEANVVSGAGGTAFRLVDSRDVLLLDNDARDQDEGVRISDSGDITVRGGSLLRNGFGVIVSRSPGDVLLEDVEGTQNHVAVAVLHSERTVMKGLRLADNAYGVWLFDTTTAQLAHSTIGRNHVGLFLENSTDNLVYDNLFDNGRVAGDANVWSQSSPGNRWYITPAPETNIMGGPWTAGNWWHDYEGMDLTGNGLGDVPHHPTGFEPDLQATTDAIGSFSGEHDMHPLVEH